ncbi:hypothetical protein KFK09_012132 [Dendrobium nobile]|uniref:Uncharacterized protein n=1 Tax=Dendrobium nobile TaxID=94219 RepID=A0A8T3BEJ2_DENNO|nr:hypothetical protein KFK09_012132 [Dendrobium nobile]
MSSESSRTPFVLAIFIFFLIINVASMQSVVTALRPLAEELRGDNGENAARLSVYEKAKEVMTLWMARLPTGPSPGGGGH